MYRCNTAYVRAGIKVWTIKHISCVEYGLGKLLYGLLSYGKCPTLQSKSNMAEATGEQ